MRGTLGSITLLSLGVVLWLLALEMVLPYYFLQTDNSVQWLPAYVHNWRAVVGQQTIPLINFHQALGQDFIGQMQTGVFYLPVYAAVGLSLSLFGHVYATIEFLAFAHLLAAAIGVYLLLRRKKVTYLLSILGGWLWITFPFIASLSRDWITTSYMAAYIPLSWLLFERLMEKQTFGRVLSLVVVKILFFSQGYVQNFMEAVVIEMLYFALLIFYFKNKLSDVAKKMRWYGLVLVLVFFATLPLIGAGWSAKQNSLYRAERLPFQEFLARRVTVVDFWQAQSLQFESPFRHPELYTLHFGIVGIALFGVLMHKSIRDRYFKFQHNRMYIALALSGLLLSGVLYIVFYLVPVLNAMRWPIKFYYFFLFFALISLVTLGQTIIGARKARGPIIALLVFMLVVNMLIVWNYRESILPDWGMEVPPRLEMMENIGRDGRMVLYNIPRHPGMYRVAPFNYATLFDRFQLTAYDPLIARLNIYHIGRSFLLWGVFEYPMTTEWLEHLSQWSVRYIITAATSSNVEELGSFGALKLIYSADDLLVYENTAARPFVYAFGSENKEVRHTFGVNHVDIYPADSDDSQRLIITVAPLKGFRYKVDGKKMGAISTREGPIELKIPPHARHVKLYFVNKFFNGGLIVSALFWLLLGLYYLSSLDAKTSNRGSSG